MLDLNDVALFVQVVRTGSFAEAARRLATPANTVSRRVQALEAHLGQRLLQRSTRRLGLTEAGRRFFEKSAPQVEALAESAQAIVDSRGVPTGRIRVATPADFFNWFPMEWISDFLALHPRVQLDFVLNDARADLMAEAIDVAFRAARTLEPNLVARAIGSSRISMVASPAYLAARGIPTSPHALLAHDCLAFMRPLGPDPWRFELPEGPLSLAVTGRFSANTSQALLRACVTGLGIAWLPSVMTANAVASGDLVEVMPELAADGTGVYLVYLSRRQLPPAVSAFIAFVAGKMEAIGFCPERPPETMPTPADFVRPA